MMSLKHQATNHSTSTSNRPKRHVRVRVSRNTASTSPSFPCSDSCGTLHTSRYTNESPLRRCAGFPRSTFSLLFHDRHPGLPHCTHARVVARACRTRAKPVQHGKRETCVETTLERLLLHTFSVCQGPARTDSIVIYLFVGQRAARLSLIPRWFQGMSQCLHSSFRVLFRLRGQGFIHQ